MVLDDPYHPVMLWRMRFANFAFKMAYLHCFHPLLSIWIQLEAKNGTKYA